LGGGVIVKCFIHRDIDLKVEISIDDNYTKRLISVTTNIIRISIEVPMALSLRNP